MFGGYTVAKKFYAVRKGNNIGLYHTWEECKSAIVGYSGAEYKGFATEIEAKAYLNDEDSSVNIDLQDMENINGIVAYVDGSYNNDLQKYAFGCIILTPKGDIIKESGCDNKPDGIAVQNIAGELLGALHVTRWAITNGFTAIEIRHDYEGIAKWFTGEWKAKNKVTQSYVEEMGKMKGVISISFIKVVAHSHDRFNDEADRLAKEALKTGRKARITKGEFWFCAEGIEYDDINAIKQLVEEEYSEVITSELEIPYGKRIELVIPRKQRVVMNHYNSKKLVIGGNPKTLFCSIISYVTELVDMEKIPEIFNSTFNVEIDKEHVKTEYKCLLPYSHNKLPDKMSRVLHQSVYNLNLHGDFFEGTFLVQPAFRVLEAHLKKILIDQLIIKDIASIKTNGFYMFDKIGCKYQMKSDMMGIATPDVAKYIGNCYTYYNMHRHTLSHWDDPTMSIDTTTIIDKNDAHQMIRKTLSIIDEYYKLLG